MASDDPTAAILEALGRRAGEFGDDYSPQNGRVRVRCFQPDKHRQGDAHPSALYMTLAALREALRPIGLAEIKEESA